jgi:hypothetical protein
MYNFYILNLEINIWILLIIIWIWKLSRGTLDQVLDDVIEVD